MLSFFLCVGPAHTLLLRDYNNPLKIMPVVSSEQILGLLEAFIVINISMWTQSKGFIFSFWITDPMLGSVNVCIPHIFASGNKLEGGYAFTWSRLNVAHITQKVLHETETHDNWLSLYIIS